MKNSVMSWVDLLPGVENTDLQKRRDEITALMQRSEQLLKEAEELRSKAYFASLAIESTARGKWSFELIEKLKMGN